MKVWKDIKGYEGFYQVSDDGKVRSVDRIIMRSNGIPRPVKQRVLKQGVNDNRFRFVILAKNGTNQCSLVHRLVALTFNPASNENSDVVHKDGNTMNNRLQNLEYQDREYRQTWHSKQRKPFKLKYTIECVELKRTFRSIVEAANSLNIQRVSISYAISGRLKTAGGYTWIKHPQRLQLPNEMPKN